MHNPQVSSGQRAADRFLRATHNATLWTVETIIQEKCSAVNCEQVRGNGHQIPPLSDRHAEKTSALFHGPFAGKLPDSSRGNPSRCGNMRGAKEFPGVTPMVSTRPAGLRWEVHSKIAASMSDR